jgi:acyl-CoA dehydrogenase
MNVQEPHVREAVADNAGERISLDSSSFPERTAFVAAAAAAEADIVDRDARFPQKAIEAARRQKLLGAQIPREFGGSGASMFDIADMR